MLNSLVVLPAKAIELALQNAVKAVLPDANLAAVQVRPCPEPKFGDYQTNALISLAKSRKINPRELAAQVLARLDVGQWCEPVEIAGAGFLNFRLKRAAMAATLAAAAAGAHLFFEKAAQPRTVVVDFSSPNVAKPMHVGHIRSTILGDSLARVLRLLGHRVVTDNHLGDWGTQFGKLLVGWKTRLNAAALQADPISEMERLYKETNAASERDPAVLEAARQELVKLQRGDPENLRLWREMIALSQKQFDEIYGRLGVRFEQTLGESFYNSRLQPLAQELREKGIARESEGALAIFFEDHPQLKATPALIQKSDGGFNYTTTDLATLAYRLETWHPDEILYVTDGRQQLHFQQLFAAFQRWHPEAKVKLAHVWFGSILGEDGKPFKTRTGETVKLSDLLNEAEERALKVVTEKSPELPEPERRNIARVIGLGAVKYADLLPNRQSDYVFSWDKMLALNGNTAPYLQYAYARIRSIFRKGQVGEAPKAGEQAPVQLEAVQELALARHLLNFGFVLEMVAEDYRPNLLCNYLYELAGHFTAFYENCPVLKAEPAQRASRLVLCELTARVLSQGLGVLGIEVIEQM
ncbi:MAG TPA: arginine--tRNA ligase [Verrucomicrobiae bacterium]|nr:arginine--tRNA ligase [Verrucomicrobiae bacterium]